MCVEQVCKVGNNICALEKNGSLFIHVIKNFTPFEMELESSSHVEEPWFKHKGKLHVVERESRWERAREKANVHKKRQEKNNLEEKLLVT
jgi:hypothetical protein